MKLAVVVLALVLGGVACSGKKASTTPNPSPAMGGSTYGGATYGGNAYGGNKYGTGVR